MSPDHHSRDDGALHEEAARWVARMRADDAGRERDAFRAWLDRDPRHALFYHRINALLPPPRQGLEPAVESRRSLHLGQLAAAAAIAAMVASLAVYCTQVARSPTGQRADLKIDKVARLETPVGSIRAIRLADGTRIVLDSSSLVLVTYTLSERRLQLVSGRMRVQPHAERRPLTIEAGGRRVHVTGALAEAAFEKDMSARITMQVSEADRTIPAGQDHSRNVPPPVTADGDNPPDPNFASGDWTTGLRRFDKAPLSIVIDELNRYSRLPIRVADADLMRLEISGRIHVNRPDRVVDNLARALRLRVERSPVGIVLHRSG